MEVTPNWLKMPDEIMRMILQRVGALQILKSAEKVCSTWRRICKDPAMWKVIHIHHGFHARSADYDIVKLSKQAVDRSCGELMDVSLEGFGTDDLLDYISRCSSKLNHLRLSNSWARKGFGLIMALKRLPHLETLELFYIYIYAEDIEVIGHNCPQLKSFILKPKFIEFVGDEFRAIANSMPALRYLKLDGRTIDNDGVRAILNGCPHLESLDLRGCFYLRLDGNLEKLCRERIKDFKFKRNTIPEEYAMDFGMLELTTSR